ncbi:MAG: AbgT family transporter [Bacilli bacterium]|nr:AbgT family transporter [Bacilli bacterium]
MTKKNKYFHPVMAFLILTGITMIISGILSLLDISTTLYKINSTTLEYSTELVKINNMFSLSGMKYIFSETVSNFVNFAPFSSLIIILIGFGVMESSGFLKAAITFLTKKMKKNTVTFIIVFLSIIGSVMGDLAYVILLPLSALIFKYGKRNPWIGIIASFAGLTCGQGLSFIFTSVDSSLLSMSLTAARVIDIGYRMASISGVFIMAAAVVILSILLTNITEKELAPKLGKYESEEEEVETTLGKKEVRGLVFSLLASGAYVLFFLYNIIPGLPFSGALLDNSQILYIDKLFSYNSFFSNGFVFVVTMFFIILGLFYGLGARTIESPKDFVNSLGYALDGIGNTIVLIFVASLFISVFKNSNIGSVIVAFLANLIREVGFSGIPLIILLILVSMISTLVMPTSISKWAILSPIAIPVFMNAGITPEFTQVIFRFGESITMGLTPLMAYFVIYLAMLNKYKPNKENLSVTESIKHQAPFALVTGIALMIIIILWYVIGLPIGFNGVTVL